MTRENKLALVVGFGLILFVGILISDHFAPSHSRLNPDLGDPSLAARGQKQRGLTELNPRPPVAANQSTLGGQRSSASLGGGDAPPEAPITPESEFGPGVRALGGSAPGSPEDARSLIGGPTAPPLTGPATVEDRVYVVRDGDTLYGIAKRELGNGSLWTKLRDLNGLRQGQPLRVGARLKLPSGSAAIERVALNDRGEPRDSEVAGREYTVRAGDTLSLIAERLLGKRSRWQELHELNKPRIKDPNHLAPGTRLMLPPSARSGSRA